MDDEFNARAVDMLKASDALLMGRRACELMAGCWPTDTDTGPVVKEKMNGAPMLDLSRTLKKVEWQNSRLATGAMADAIVQLRERGAGLRAHAALRRASDPMR